MAMWKMTTNGPVPIAPKKLDFEDRLEDLVVSDPSLINLSILVIGRQMADAFGALAGLSHIDANRWIISEISARLRSGAALPGLCEAIRSYRPDLVVSETV